MNKVDAIRLAADSPLGEQTIGGGGTRLSEFDLVVITGPNGSGKSTIAEALCDFKAGVSVASQDRGSAGLDTPGAVEKSLLVRTGAQLMGPFASLEAALASGSGVTRVRDDKRLLQLLVAERSNAPYRLDRFVSKATSIEDADLLRAINDYLAVETRAANAVGVGRPLTLATYNEIGSEVAGRLGVEWPICTQVDEQGMRLGEEAVSPRARVISGEAELLGAISPAIAALDGKDSDSIVLELSDADQSLRNEVENAEALAPLAADEAAPRPGDWPVRCERLAAAEDERVADLGAKRQALDLLGTIRRQAEQWIADHEADQCPVCRGDIAREHLLSELRDHHGGGERTAEIDREIEACMARAVSLRSAASALRQSLKQVAESKLEATRFLARRQGSVKELLENCQSATHWHPEIEKASRIVREACEGCLESSHWSGDNIEAVREAVREIAGLVDRITAVKVDREERAESARRDLKPAESAYRQLGPLRELLVAREALNARAWEPRWEAAAADERKRVVIERWKKAVQELIDELGHAEEQAQREILENEHVKARFASLCRASGHPLLVEAEFDERRVTADDEAIETVAGNGRVAMLSEGCRVIVNLAAFIAVAGHVCDGQQHQAGWIVLDEPTNALDAKNRREVAKYLGGLTTELMPRQMFVTTFEDDFVKELVTVAKASGRRTLVVQLPAWTGSVPVTPTLRIA